MPSTNGGGAESERIGVYMRVSSEEQERKQSIKTQRRASSRSTASSTATR